MKNLAIEIFSGSGSFSKVAHSFGLKELDDFGRGAKNKVPGTFSNMTKVQRQKTPEKLIKDILTQLPI